MQESSGEHSEADIHKVSSIESDPGPETAEQPTVSSDFKLPIKEPGYSHKGVYTIIAGVFIVGLTFIGGFFMMMSQQLQQASIVNDSPSPSSTVSKSPLPNANIATLNTSKNYGDKYASGILPVGDSKYKTDAAKKGYIYACSQYSQSLTGIGADTRGPWFVNNNTEYNINEKIHVRGTVSWSGSFNNVVNGSTRTITTNDLPGNHTTGIFPIDSTDPAHSYDKNPNGIAAQTLTYSLPASPTYGDPQCMGGEAGVMLTGVAIFNGFDAGAHDAGAWEVQDGCQGHPQSSGEYHYHTLSSCIKDTSVHTVLGFALDGFPITGPKVSNGNYLTTSDLDVCHGIQSQITLDGKSVTMYHYVMTQDFPYSISCFRAKATNPPGQHENAGGQAGQGGTPPPQGQAIGGYMPPQPH